MSDEAADDAVDVDVLLQTSTVQIRDVRCVGACQHRSAEECATKTHLVYPYRGLFARHVGSKDTIAEANQLVFFNDDEDYFITHPIGGGDACISIAIDDELLRELAPADQLDRRTTVAFRQPRRTIDPKAQALVARLRHGLSRGGMETLEAETLALALIRRSLGERTSHLAASTYGREKLVDRTKVVLAAEPGRRWTLASIAKKVGVSPVYLTQVFSDVEGMPLYRYQLRLRLARALDELDTCDDLTMLALDLGFSSHSHFTAAFRQHYGCSPAEFRGLAYLR